MLNYIIQDKKKKKSDEVRKCRTHSNTFLHSKQVMMVHLWPLSLSPNKDSYSVVWIIYTSKYMVGL